MTVLFYPELVHKFFANLCVKNLGESTTTKILKFRISCKPFHLSFDELNMSFGLVSYLDLSTDDYLESFVVDPINLWSVKRGGRSWVISLSLRAERAKGTI